MRAIPILAIFFLFLAMASAQTDVTTAAPVTAKPTSLVDRIRSNAATLATTMRESAKQVSQTVQTKLSELTSQMGLTGR